MRWLLPEHIDDILPAEAMRVEWLRRLILDLFFENEFVGSPGTELEFAL